MSRLGAKYFNNAEEQKHWLVDLSSSNIITTVIPTITTATATLYAFGYMRVWVGFVISVMFCCHVFLLT